jgi:L-threonylcarbamoyladenylate synthase
MNPVAADVAAIELAAAELLAGRLVAFPTETVYGLGADAGSRDAVAAIYRLKGRPPDHPLIVHVSGVGQARRWAQWGALAQRLAEAFWPGPLTLILERLAQAPAWACGGQSTVGLRVPAHPVALALLRAVESLGGLGVAAPSANRFGRVSPTRASHVIDDLGEQAPLVLDAGACEVGVESTIVDLSRGIPVLLRPGGISADRIEQAIGERLRFADAAAPRASGTLAAHYAPRTPLERIDAQQMKARIAALSAAGLRVGAWSLARPDAGETRWVRLPADPVEAGHDLYDTLRSIDRLGLDRVIVECSPGGPDWAAVDDRLQRAEAGSAIEAP